MTVINYRFPLVEFDFQSFYPQLVATTNAIDRMQRRFRDFREPLNKSVRNILIPSIIHNFVVEGRPPWIPLAPSTVRRRKGSAHPILFRTGYLMKRATQINIWAVDRNTAWVRFLDAKISYAKFHQGGTFHHPARPFMKFHAEDILGIEMIFVQWMERVIDDEWSR